MQIIAGAHLTVSCIKDIYSNSLHIPRQGTVDQLLKEVLPGECGVPEEASTQFLLTLAKVRGGIIPTRFDSPWLVSLHLTRVCATYKKYLAPLASIPFAVITG